MLDKKPTEAPQLQSELREPHLYEKYHALIVVMLKLTLEKNALTFSTISQQRNGTGSLTHWGRVTHICVGNLTIIGSDNGLSPGRRQAIIWTSAEILLIEPPGTSFSEIIEIHTISFNKMHLKMSSAKWWSFCSGLNVLNPPHIYSAQPLPSCFVDILAAQTPWHWSSLPWIFRFQQQKGQLSCMYKASDGSQNSSSGQVARPYLPLTFLVHFPSLSYKLLTFKLFTELPQLTGIVANKRIWFMISNIPRDLHRGEALYISLIDFQRTSTETKSFQ